MRGLRLSAYVHSAQGPRASQQDRWLCDPATGLFAVADGMGGHTDGDRAAQMAIEVLARQSPHGPPAPTLMARWFQGADRAVRALASPCRVTGTKQHKMSCYCPGAPGTTLTALWVGPQAVVLGHSGDSACWRLRQGRWDLLTTAHRTPFDTLVQYVGVEHRDRNPPQILALDPAAAGDLYLLHTDGLDVLHETDQFFDLCAQAGDDLARILVEAALFAGTKDNTTALVVRLLAPAAASEEIGSLPTHFPASRAR